MFISNPGLLFSGSDISDRAEFPPNTTIKNKQEITCVLSVNFIGLHLFCAIGDITRRTQMLVSTVMKVSIPRTVNYRIVAAWDSA